jgi:hypothetical protein
MVPPDVKRDAVVRVCTQHGVSQRRVIAPSASFPDRVDVCDQAEAFAGEVVDGSQDTEATPVREGAARE